MKTVAKSADGETEWVPTADIAIDVTGFTEVAGHTEYQVCSQLSESGAQHRSQRRFNEFCALHTAIQPGLGLPPAFPVPKLLLHGDTVKQERAAKLEAYLRQAATAAKESGRGLPPPLAQFLNLPGPSGMGSAH